MIISADTYSPSALMHEGILALSRAEQYGIHIDVDYCKKVDVHLEKQIKFYKNEFETSTLAKRWKHIYKNGTNFNSDHQLSHILFKNMGIEPKKHTANGNPSTDEEALSALCIDEIDYILKLRHLDKVKTTYIGAFLREQVDGILHPVFNLHIPLTFRSSSDSPNFQNIPNRDPKLKKLCRKAIKARKGRKLLCVDYGGIEVKIAACVVGSTEIETIDGKQSIVEVIQRVNNKEKVYVYGYDLKNNRIGISKVIEGGITKQNTRVFKVTLDNGESITATPNHKFLLRNGEYKELRHLEVGDSLMPLYKKNQKSRHKTNYTKVYLNNGKSMLEHNLIALDIFGVEIGSSKFIMHHKNGNGKKNSLDNLDLITRKRHMQIHSIQGWNNPKHKNRNDWMKTEKGKKHVKKLHKKLKEIMSTEKGRIEQGFRISEGIKRNGGRIGNKNAMFGKTQSEETKLKISCAKKGVKTNRSWNKGLTKETSVSVLAISLKAKNREVSEETRKKISIAGTGRMHTEATRLLLKNRPVKQETRDKLRQSKLEYWKNKQKTFCKICNKAMATVTNTHLKYTHNISVEEYKETYNHKVVKIESAGNQDVYNITVKGLHNYAVGAGVVIKNCYHKDPTMMKYINDPTTDMHRDTAMDCFLVKDPALIVKAIRHTAKNMFVFPQFYGDWYKSCAESMWIAAQSPTHVLSNGLHLMKHLASKGIKTYDRFEKNIKRVEDLFWNTRFPVYTEWKEEWWTDYCKRGYIDMYTGFRCHGVLGRNDCINYPVQGAAFHCLLLAFILLDRIQTERGWKSRLIAQIHDEVILEVHPDEEQEVLETVQWVMCEEVPRIFTWINVPLIAEAEITGIDETWYDKKAIGG